jgi:hypothetical protein
MKKTKIDDKKLEYIDQRLVVLEANKIKFDKPIVTIAYGLILTTSNQLIYTVTFKFDLVNLTDYITFLELMIQITLFIGIIYLIMKVIVFML